jgi:hypothetical protein
MAFLRIIKIIQIKVADRAKQNLKGRKGGKTPGIRKEMARVSGGLPTPRIAGEMVALAGGLSLKEGVELQG